MFNRHVKLPEGRSMFFCLVGIPFFVNIDWTRLCPSNIGWFPGFGVLHRIEQPLAVFFKHCRCASCILVFMLSIVACCVFFLVIPWCFSWMFMCSLWVFDRSSYFLKLIAVPTFWSLTCSYFLEVNIELVETMFARDWTPNETNAGCPTASCDTSSPTCGLGPSIAPWSVESTLRLVGWWGLIGGDKW